MAVRNSPPNSVSGYTMHAAGGIGIAAPQVGVPLQVAVVDIGWERWELVNPELVAADGEQESREGCLSIPSVRLTVRRPARVTVRAKDRRGVEQLIVAEGALARVVCHELDHLRGVLMVDLLSEDEWWQQLMGELLAAAQTLDTAAEQNGQTEDSDGAMAEEMRVDGEIAKAEAGGGRKTPDAENADKAEQRLLPVDDPDWRAALDLLADAAWKLTLAAEWLNEWADRPKVAQAQARIAEAAAMAEAAHKVLSID